MKETVLDCDFIILNRLPHIYSAQRFQAEIERHKLNAKLISPEVLIDQASHFESRGFRPAVLYRQGDYNFWATHKALSKLPFKIVNSPSAFLHARDKWTSHQAWKTAGIPTPQTLLASSVLDSPRNYSPIEHAADQIHKYLETTLGSPYIFKKRFSSQGRGVFLVENASVLQALLLKDLQNFKDAHDHEIHYFKNAYMNNQFTSPSQNWLQLNRWIAQKYVSENTGKDTRVFIIENVLHAIERKNENSFLSNLHQGGVAYPTRLSDKEEALTKQVHQLSGLQYSGIDFLRTTSGPLFLEINPSPGFEGIETVYPAINIAGSLLDMLVRQLRN